MGALLGQSKQADHDLGIDPISIITAASGLIKPVASLIGGGDHQAKCDAIKKYRNQLISRGVDRIKIQNQGNVWKCEQYKAGSYLMAIFDAAPSQALAAQYINETIPSTITVSVAQRMLNNLPAWLKQQQGWTNNLPTNSAATSQGFKINPTSLAITGGSILALGTVGYFGYQYSKKRK